ncbi:MAG: YebC/PmpR family DNA-binding transcriptional regulator [Planctomycetota bacterium]|jgi:YebC/PmpR family DNA-binding regulatory protein|nr:YebC/PmpR family DNA-binding transcriptional regulator [Planctomycetota bacterium]
MAGHSHWAGIKHKKAIADKKRGKVFSKVSKKIILAAREGGGDPDANLKLKYAIEEAKAANMPADNIQRAVKKGTGELSSKDVLLEINYEGYGPAGVALLVEVVTDNRNRTAGSIRKTFESRGGNLGSTGCVSWMFESKGLFLIPKEGVDEDSVLDTAIEAGAQDVSTEDENYIEITCTPSDYLNLKGILESEKLPLEVAEIAQIPSTFIAPEAKDARKVLQLIAALEDDEDVQKVHSNLEASEEILAEVE